MNERFQHDPDDELLSAYLDDELSAEERALVESRLATDASARQTLEQLRHVSHSVRELPQESVGDDLRDKILRQIDAAKTTRHASDARAAATPEPPAPGPLPSTISIGRTARGWIWATVAIAAGLLMMFLLPENERDDVVDVAQNTIRSADKSASDKTESADGRRSDRMLREQPAPAAAPEFSGLSTARQSSAEIAGAPVMTEGIDSADAASSSDGRSDDFGTIAAMPPQSDGEYGIELRAAPASGTSGPIAKGESTSTRMGLAMPAPVADDSAPGKPVVVNVLAKRAAIENKAFEKLLTSNGVELEPAKASSEQKSPQLEESLAAAAPAPAVSGRVAQSPADAPPAEAKQVSDVELVLVEAPASTVFSCLDQLKDDTTNYLGIAVENTPSENVGEEVDTFAYGAGADTLQRFNRGVVPPVKAARSGGKLHYFDPKKGSSYFGRDQQFGGGGVGGYSENVEEESPAEQSRLDRGRALRIEPQSAFELYSSDREAPASQESETVTRESTARSSSREKQPSQKSMPADRMQVLFIIQPEDSSPATLKAKN